MLITGTKFHNFSFSFAFIPSCLFQRVYGPNQLNKNLHCQDNTETLLYELQGEVSNQAIEVNSSYDDLKQSVDESPEQ